MVPKLPSIEEQKVERVMAQVMSKKHWPLTLQVQLAGREEPLKVETTSAMKVKQLK